MWSYYAYKGWTRVSSLVTSHQSGWKRRPGVLQYLDPRHPIEKVLVLDFDDKNLIHLGDQIFHQRLIQTLKPHMKIYILGDTPLRSYFEELGVEFVNRDDVIVRHKSGLVVGTYDQGYRFGKTFRNTGFSFLGIHYGRLPLERGAIAEGIVRECVKTLQLLGHNFSEILLQKFLPLKPPARFLKSIQQKIGYEMVASQSFFVFNDYVNSNFMDANKRRPLLWSMAQKKSDEGFGIVYVGSSEDVERLPRVPPFVNLDLRGQLSLMEVFSLLSAPNIVGLLSFDTFICHMASLMGIPLHVVIKNDKRAPDFKSKFVPMFEGNDDLVREWI